MRNTGQLGAEHGACDSWALEAQDAPEVAGHLANAGGPSLTAAIEAAEHGVHGILDEVRYLSQPRAVAEHPIAAVTAEDAITADTRDDDAHGASRRAGKSPRRDGLHRGTRLIERARRAEHPRRGIGGAGHQDVLESEPRTDAPGAGALVRTLVTGEGQGPGGHVGDLAREGRDECAVNATGEEHASGLLLHDPFVHAHAQHTEERRLMEGGSRLAGGHGDRARLDLQRVIDADDFSGGHPQHLLDGSATTRHAPVPKERGQYAQVGPPGKRMHRQQTVEGAREEDGVSLPRIDEGTLATRIAPEIERTVGTRQPRERVPALDGRECLGAT